MPSTGFGSTPYGAGPYGLGTPDGAAVPGGKVLRNTFSGVPMGSRKIDTLTGRYEMDAYGRVTGMSDAQQLVLLRVKTDKASSAVRTLGHELRKLDRVTENFQKRVSDTYTNALADIVELGIIAVDSIKAVQVRPGATFVHIRFRDLSTEQEHEVTV